MGYYDDGDSGMGDADYLALSRMFRDPGGRSALGPGRRTEDCPTCGAKKVLTKADRRKGYQCDGCADRAEGRGYGSEY